MRTDTQRAYDRDWQHLRTQLDEMAKEAQSLGWGYTLSVNDHGDERTVSLTLWRSRDAYEESNQ